MLERDQFSINCIWVKALLVLIQYLLHYDKLQLNLHTLKSYYEFFFIICLKTAPINLYPAFNAASMQLKMVSRPLILNVPTE
jgi:hypothetical protein